MDLTKPYEVSGDVKRNKTLGPSEKHQNHQKWGHQEVGGYAVRAEKDLKSPPPKGNPRSQVCGPWEGGPIAKSMGGGTSGGGWGFEKSVQGYSGPGGAVDTGGPRAEHKHVREAQIHSGAIAGSGGETLTFLGGGLSRGGSLALCPLRRNSDGGKKERQRQRKLQGNRALPRTSQEQSSTKRGSSGPFPERVVGCS